jgi:hypothetical protein
MTYKLLIYIKYFECVMANGLSADNWTGTARTVG